jgi:hypothetical protein
MPPMRITSRGFATATGGLVSAVVLVGCSSNSTKPTVLPSLQTTTPAAATSAARTPAATSSAPTPSSVASTTTTSTPPTAPTTTASRLAATNIAIQKAVQDYYATLNRALVSSAAAAEVAGKFRSTCQQCAKDYSNIKQIHAKGWVVSGGSYNISKVVPQANDKNTGAATITFTVSAIIVHDSHGKLIAHDEGQGSQSAGLTVDRSGKRWLVVGYIDFGNTS